MSSRQSERDTAIIKQAQGCLLEVGVAIKFALFLKVHARDKSISRSGDGRWPEEALLRRTAELTVGYSGAALANLLNEAAILMVLYSAPPFTIYRETPKLDWTSPGSQTESIRRRKWLSYTLQYHGFEVTEEDFVTS